MKQLIVSKEIQNRIQKGIDLLDEKSFKEIPEYEGWVTLKTSQNQFLAIAYLSKQHKGLGWVVSRLPIEIDEAFWLTLFQKAWEKRNSYHQDEQTTAYRLFNQDGDGFGGLTIDYYDGYVVFSWYNAFIYSLRQEILTAFQVALPMVLGGYEKIRFQGLDYESRHAFGKEAPETFLVLENGVSYHVFLNDGLMTGIFLDQHDVRGRLVDGLVAGKRVLNMFSYTAAFSVAAAMGGAMSTTSVDLAKRSRELSEAHFKANNIPLDNHQFVVMDVFEYFKYAKRKGFRFDAVILDPPSFARHKKQTFSVSKDYYRLVSQSLELLEEGGLLIVSTNASNLSVTKFKEQIAKGFGAKNPEYLASYRLPEDFQTNKKDESSDYLKVFVIRV